MSFSDYIKRVFRCEDEIVNERIESGRQHLIEQGMDPHYRYRPEAVVGGWCERCGELICECEEERL